MRHPRPRALIGGFAVCGVGFKFTAHRWAVFVNAAECTGNLAFELFATRGFTAGAAHAAHGGRALFRGVYGHPATGRIICLSPIERDTVHGATGTTVHAG